MNNRGFTLIELIFVVAIIALLSIIMTPNVLVLIEKNKVDNYNGTLDSIIKAAENYVSDNRYNRDVMTFDCLNATTPSSVEITFEDLYKNGYLSKMPVDSCNDNAELDGKVEISFDCNSKKYNYKLVGNNLNKKNENKCDKDTKN